MNQSCANCKNFNTGAAVFAKLRAANVIPAGNTAPGLCQLNAPVKSPDGIQFPVMAATDVCGQWAAKSA